MCLFISFSAVSCSCDGVEVDIHSPSVICRCPNVMEGEETAAEDDPLELLLLSPPFSQMTCKDIVALWRRGK